MILDSESTTLYLSELIHSNNSFFSCLSKLLWKRKIEYRFLPQTRDIWAVDYMPVQVSLNKFIQFKYEPDYLRPAKYAITKTNPREVCAAIGLNPIPSSIILDGGNVIKGKNWAILTDKVFKENPMIPQNRLINELEKLFEAKVIIIPREPYDFTGHADGMVRYFDEDTLLINDYGEHQSDRYQSRLRRALDQHQFKLIEIPYSPDDSNLNSAKGIYLNFLEMKDFILVPTFGQPEDEIAVARFENLFPNRVIETIDASEIAREGGVLHCISWTVASMQQTSKTICTP